MSNLDWWPAYMVDERMPQPEASPSAWIREALGDKWLIAEREEDRDLYGDGEISPLRQTVAPGEIVDFMYCERHGTIRVRLIDGKSFEAIDAVPAGANAFNIAFDFEACGDTLEEAVGHALREPGQYGAEIEVACTTWSDYMPHRFEIGEDGPRFVAVQPVATAGNA